MINQGDARGSQRANAAASARSNNSMRSSLTKVYRCSTQGSALAPARNTPGKPRSNSLELLLFEVHNAFDPNSQFIQTWHQMLLLCLLYEVTILPYLVTFRSSMAPWLTSEIVVVYVCELLFVLDIYVELNTGYYEDGDVTRDVKKSRIKYFKSARFALDILALPPLLLLPISLPMQVSPVVLEMHKLVRAWRIPKYIAELDDVYAKHFVVLKMFKVLVATLLLSHFVACVRFRFGYDVDNYNAWLPQVPEEEQTAQTKYLVSLFWAFGLLTGLFDGGLPRTVPQFLFTIFVALCGFSLFTYLCATFFMISKCESGSIETSEARLNQFKHVLSFHRVPDYLQEQAIEYLKRYHTYTESNDREAMRLLCPSISKDVQVSLLKDMVGEIAFFQGCDDQFIVAIASLLEMISLPAHCIVFHAGDKGDAMYLVNSGVLHVLVDGMKVHEERKGDFFGEMSIFLHRPRFATVVTTTYCTLYKLVRFHMERVLEGYPEYAISIPKKVEEMARSLFRGDSRGAQGAGLAKAGKKKTISNLLRKHIHREKKVAPSLTWLVANAVAEKKALQISQAATVTTDTQLPTPESSDPAGPQLLLAENPSPTTQAPKSSNPAVMKNERGSGEASADQGRPPAPTPTPSIKLSSGSRKRSSLTMPPVMQMVYAQVGTRLRSDIPRWSVLLLPKAIEFESSRRMWWILVLQINLLYSWLVIPVQLVFRFLSYPTWYIDMLNTVMDIGLLVDIYLNFNLAYVESSEKISNTCRTATKYFKSRFALDLFCALPFGWLARGMRYDYLRIPRLLRVWRAPGHFNEVDAYLQLESKQRLLLFSVLLMLFYHIIACLHFSVTYIEGFSPSSEAWIPSNDIYLRELNETHFVSTNNVIYAAGSSEIFGIGLMQYFRSLYYACNVLTALGRTIEPASDTQYSAALAFMLSGYFITAIVVDNVQKRFTASAFEQKEFFAIRSKIQIFLRRQNAPLAIHKRVSAFLDFWWSSHRGAVIGSLMEELPDSIKHDIMMSVCKPALQTLALLNGVRPVLSELEKVFVDNVKVILYGQGEIVYRQGDFAGGIFFVLEGEVCFISNGGQPRGIPQGGFFGTAALHLDNNSANYLERVTAISGCIVLFVSREQLHVMRKTFPELSEALFMLEKRFLDPKLAKASEVGSAHTTTNNHTFRWLMGLVLDPDTVKLLFWEIWVFIAMTIQWLSVMYISCFGINHENRLLGHVIMVLIELTFVGDMFVRSRLGYHEFGNKVMDLRLIQRNYFHSRDFIIDLVALLPMYVINWGIESTGAYGWEILNLNKLVRLIKAPRQFTALENKYLKYTLEVRLFKLVYYTFLLSHTLGCLWFDFRSHASRLESIWGVPNESATMRPGEEKWLPPAELVDADPMLQYFSSLFWSFGLMSAINTGDLPKTVSQCIFNLATMTFGFFLFAYVVGNFSDSIELMDAENREFYATLSSLRHLLAHFNLPVRIQERFKTYFFFKRFHSITQEYLLESCLPPSLLTDIRMVHLQPMMTKVTFLSDMDGSVTRMLVSQFSQMMIVKNEYVYKYGEEGSDMYFVFAGLLDTLVPPQALEDDNDIGFAEANRDVGKSVKERKADKNAKKVEDKGDGDDCEEKDEKDEEEVKKVPQRRSSIMPAVEGFFAKVKSRSRASVRPQKVKSITDTLTKLNEISAGGYFGENALYVNSVRSNYVLARTSCVLYKLSRDSLETVFHRYPDWRIKVLRIMKLEQEQLRLNHIATAEIRSAARASTRTVRESAMDERASRTEKALMSSRYQRGSSLKKLKGRMGSHSGPKTKPPKSKKGPRSFFRVPEVMSVLFHGAPAQGVYHLLWLKVVIFATIFMSLVVPYRISFDPMERSTWVPVLCRMVETMCELLYLADIWVSWRIQRSKESMDFYEQDHQQAYKKERLTWDLLAALPLDYLLSSFLSSPMYRINRCLKLRHLMHYTSELNRRSIYNEMNRLRTTSVLYILIIYWSACTYYAIAVFDHFGDEWDAWLPDASLDDPPTGKRTLRLLRGLFFATTSFVKKGRTFTPETTFHYVFVIITCFVGLLTMAFMIGEFANLFISYIVNEVKYRKNHIAVELYLGRWKISGELRRRTHAFLSSFWSSHRGVDYQSFMEDVPACIRTESILHIANKSLKSFTMDVCRPVCHSEEQGALNELIQSLAPHLKFEGYPRGESVLLEGTIAKGMYFVARGRLFSSSRSQPNVFRGVSLAQGDYFGDKGLLGCSVSAFSVRTLRSCDLLSLSSEALVEALCAHRIYGLAYEIAAQAVKAVRSRERVSSALIITETGWGEAVLDVINSKLADVSSVRKNSRTGSPSAGKNHATASERKKTRELIEKHFFLDRVIDAFGAFRSMLQLFVPNGLLHASGATPVALPLPEKRVPAYNRVGPGIPFDELQQEALTIIARLFQPSSTSASILPLADSVNEPPADQEEPKSGPCLPPEMQVVLTQREEPSVGPPALPRARDGPPTLPPIQHRPPPIDESSDPMLRKRRSYS